MTSDDFDYGQLTKEWWHEAAPDDPRKLVALRQIEQRGQQLGLMMNARTLLNQAWRDVQKRASKVAPPIDAEATADRDMIAQSNAMVRVQLIFQNRQ